MEICKKCSSYDPDGKLARRTWVRGIASDYTYDAAGRRTAITKTGTAFGDLTGSIDSYTYNARSELISARRTKTSTTTPSEIAAVPRPVMRRAKRKLQPTRPLREEIRK